MAKGNVGEQLRFFGEIGVTHLRIQRPSPAAEAEPRAMAADPPPDSTWPVPDPPEAASPPTDQSVPEGPATLEQIRSELGECERCKLHPGRTQIVFGAGSPTADLMFVGEAPGADEDAQGIPFVGRAGQLLTKIIESIGLQRDGVYIANILKCRPPRNRNPEDDEVASCHPFLLRQIESISPMIIVALGKYAAQTLLQSEVTISNLRGSFHDYHGTRLMPTFHPSYLLRNPSAKRFVWEDIQKVRDTLKQLGSVYYQ